MKSSEALPGALRKLDWIAKLSKKTCPGGAPKDFDGMRKLLNRIVLDVRAACRLLEESDKRRKLDPYDTPPKPRQKSPRAEPWRVEANPVCLRKQTTRLPLRQTCDPIFATDH